MTLIAPTSFSAWAFYLGNLAMAVLYGILISLLLRPRPVPILSSTTVGAGCIFFVSCFAMHIDLIYYVLTGQPIIRDGRLNFHIVFLMVAQPAFLSFFIIAALTTRPAPQVVLTGTGPDRPS